MMIAVEIILEGKIIKNYIMDLTKAINKFSEQVKFNVNNEELFKLRTEFNTNRMRIEVERW